MKTKFYVDKAIRIIMILAFVIIGFLYIFLEGNLLEEKNVDSGAILFGILFLILAAIFLGIQFRISRSISNLAKGFKEIKLDFSERTYIKGEYLFVFKDHRIESVSVIRDSSKVVFEKEISGKEILLFGDDGFLKLISEREEPE